MYLYNLTLQKQSAIYQTISGSFTSPKTQEIVLSRNNTLELCSVDQNGKIKTLISKSSFGQIRRISSFRLTGNKKDFIVIGSDSGRIVILEASLELRDFIKLHQETYGKTGCRRIVPGEYIAVDPKGRAILIGALEKQKFVYIMNRDNDNAMTISSSLEAHKSNSICFDICGIDVGYENPLFAAIEVDYGDQDDDLSPLNTAAFQKILVYYELELSLNHVVRKNAEKIDMSAHMIVPVIKKNDIPGGLIVFCEGYLIYKSANGLSIQTQFPIRYENENKRKGMMINYGIYNRKDKYFIFTQSEFGDVFQISLRISKGKISDVIIDYFDTIPIAHSISILLPCILFSASETGNHHLYTITSFESKHNSGINSIGSSSSQLKKQQTFNPKPLANLQLIDELQSLSMITDMTIEDLRNEGVPQIYLTSGKGPRSALHILKPGLAVNNIGSSSLKGDAISVWSLKQELNSPYDKYIIVSFINATLVLSIGQKIEEISNSGFDLKLRTLHIGILSDNSYIQVNSTGIIHITKDKRNFLRSNSAIICASSNKHQLIIGLENKEVLYFDHDNGQLCKPVMKALEYDILCLDISPISEERIRAKYMAVALSNNSIRILSLEITQCLSMISVQVLPYPAASLRFIKYEMDDTVFLFLGLANGVIVKTSVDNVTGKQTDMQSKYLGSKPVLLYKIRLQGQEALISNSDRPYLCYKYMGKYYCESMNMEYVESAASFNSEQCHEGIVAIVQETVKIITIDHLDQFFSQEDVTLRYTPRKLLVNRLNGKLIVIESDQHVYSKQTKDMIKSTIVDGNKGEEEYLKLNESYIGVPYAAEGNWGSCIRIIDPNRLIKDKDQGNDQDMMSGIKEDYEYDELIEFENNEAALSACIMSFASNPNELYLIIGTAENLKFYPTRHFTSASITIFTIKDNGTKLEFAFKQPVDDIPLAFAEYEGRLLAGIGTNLILYDIGKSHLLKKCETKKITNPITQIQINGQRILVSTMNESFHLLRHRALENQFYVFADDVIPRWLLNATFLDYDTIAGCDKFETFFVYRLPSGADEENKDDPMGSKKKWEVGYLHGAAYKLDLIAQFHLGDLITSIKKISLCGGNDNVVLYCTASGALGVFVPLKTREEVDFFVHMEMYARVEIGNVIGRDHQMFRSSYGPVKSVIDGDLCEEFITLDYGKQKAFAKELDKDPNEVIKLLEDIRNKII